MLFPMTAHADQDFAVEVKTSGAKGRGVFARRRFNHGDLIERAPVILLPDEQWLEMEKTSLSNYYYNWNEHGSVLALGYGSLYNHSYKPNAVYVKHFSALLIDYVALRDIAEGEEITINYNGHPEDRRPLWFETSD